MVKVFIKEIKDHTQAEQIINLNKKQQWIFFFKINNLKISNFKYIYLVIKRNAVRRI